MLPQRRVRRTRTGHHGLLLARDGVAGLRHSGLLSHTESPRRRRVAHTTRAAAFRCRRYCGGSCATALAECAGPAIGRRCLAPGSRCG